MADKAIEVLLDERRNFPPPKEFKKSANFKSAGVFNAARKNPQAFWAKAAKELERFKPGEKSWNGIRHGQVVHRRKDPRLLQLPGSACQKAEGLDRLAMFYDVYVTRPGVRTQII